MTALHVTVLASIGRHPVSGRPRVADCEARALALALQLEAEVRVLHAGPDLVARPTLRDALGMGARRLTVAHIPADCDPLPPLVQALRADLPGIVLAGAVAETGSCAGALPFFVAEQLGLPIVTAAVALKIDGSRATVIQALSGGRRRQVAAALPFVATVERSGPSPRFSAYAKARRGEVVRFDGLAVPDKRHAVPTRTAAARSKGLRTPDARSAADRLRAIFGSDRSDRRVLAGLAPDAAAAAIVEFLAREGLIAERTQVTTDESVHAGV
jgi:electron transfer flavoprotein beta subunit